MSDALQSKLDAIVAEHGEVREITVDNSALARDLDGPKQIEIWFDVDDGRYLDGGIEEIPDVLDADLEEAGFAAIRAHARQARYQDVKYNERADPDALRGALEDAGYDPETAIEGASYTHVMRFGDRADADELRDALSGTEWGLGGVMGDRATFVYDDE